MEIYNFMHNWAIYEKFLSLAKAQVLYIGLEQGYLLPGFIIGEHIYLPRLKTHKSQLHGHVDISKTLVSEKNKEIVKED